MIKVFSTKGFKDEKKYVFDFIFNDIFKIPYSFSDENHSNYYILELENQKKIKVIDYFWNKQKSNHYIKKSNLPNRVISTSNEFSFENNIIVLYGSNKFSKSEKEIKCDIDIIASIFFMLSRWEECVNDTPKDNYNRFPFSESILCKNNFISRPIVNEYIELVRNFFSYLSFNIATKSNYRIVPTHDIDFVYKFRDNNSTVKEIIYDIFIQKEFNNGSEKLIDFFLNKANLKKDPFDTFNYLIKLSEQYNNKSHFYFRIDDCYHHLNLKYKKRIILDKILNFNHIVGFHPGLNTYYDEKKWGDEKNKFENRYNLKLKEGRQHYLQFHNPITWRIWENNHMEIDSTLCFPEHEGFRCGTANEFHVFDVYKRKKLKLIERPTIIMDNTLTTYRKLKLSTIKQIITYYKKICKKYNMPLTILFHNSSFCYSLKELKKIYPSFFNNNYEL